MIARIDREVAVLQKQIKNFETEIKADRKNLETRPQPVGPGRRERPAQPSIRKIRGIGEVSEARLKAKGITRASEVARMDKAQLAEILGTSEDRAAGFIADAKLIR